MRKFILPKFSLLVQWVCLWNGGAYQLFKAGSRLLSFVLVSSGEVLALFFQTFLVSFFFCAIPETLRSQTISLSTRFCFLFCFDAYALREADSLVQAVLYSLFVRSALRPMDGEWRFALSNLFFMFSLKTSEMCMHTRYILSTFSFLLGGSY